MKFQGYPGVVPVCAALVAASAPFNVASAHWEGFEAADPSTPAAVLRFESAASGYVETAAAPISWRTRPDDSVGSGDGDTRIGGPDNGSPGDPAESDAAEPVTGTRTSRVQPAPQMRADRGR